MGFLAQHKVRVLLSEVLTKARAVEELDMVVLADCLVVLNLLVVELLCSASQNQAMIILSTTKRNLTYRVLWNNEYVSRSVVPSFAGSYSPQKSLYCTGADYFLLGTKHALCCVLGRRGEELANSRKSQFQRGIVICA